MIEVAVPNDICKYESKLIGPFTTRETIALCLAGVVGFGLYKVLGSAFSIETVGYLIIPLVAPILVCGWYKPYGIPFEKFIWIVINTMLLSPRIRKYQIRNHWEDMLQENITTDQKGGKAKNKKNKNGENIDIAETLQEDNVIAEK